MTAPNHLPPADVDIGTMKKRALMKLLSAAYTESAVIVGLARGGAMTPSGAEAVAMAWDNWIDAIEFELKARGHDRR